MVGYELNLDGLVGPTHHYAGLSEGNIASTSNALSVANPQAAALQGIEKMRFLYNLGLKQAVFPPHCRPNLDLLRNLGFTGSPIEQINKAHRTAPELLSACYSASSMWAANAATVSCSLDTNDGKVHFTAANLISNLHRHQEADFSKTLLEKIFNNPHYFSHHPVLPRSSSTRDEGAANHNRLCNQHHSAGVNLFVYGKQGLNLDANRPHRYPARQTLEASAAIARSHQLSPDRVVFARQNPEAIDAGVFHNDVIAVANESLFLVHECAFADQKKVLAELKTKADFPLQILEISAADISLTEAVSSYLFNSQLVTLPSGKVILISPTECKTTPRVQAWIEEALADNHNPITEVHYLDLKQSMRNGGGPACLRLRIPLTTQEFRAIHPGVIINDSLLNQLSQWVIKHYRTALHANDLADPQLLNESIMALDELTQLLKLGSIYSFQQK